MYIFTLWVHLNSNFNSHTDCLADTSSEPPSRTRCALTSTCLLLPPAFPSISCNSAFQLFKPKPSLLTPLSHHIQPSADPFGSVFNTRSTKSCSLPSSAAPASRRFSGTASASGLPRSILAPATSNPEIRGFRPSPSKSFLWLQPPHHPVAPASTPLLQPPAPPARSCRDLGPHRSALTVASCSCTSFGSSLERRLLSEPFTKHPP